MAYCTSQDRALPNSCASVINSDVITIMIVEIEAIVGSIWSRSALNMFRVRVELSPPEMNIATTTSSKEDRNDSSNHGKANLRQRDCQEDPPARRTQAAGRHLLVHVVAFQRRCGDDQDQ
jgi:hypothetical protein